MEVPTAIGRWENGKRDVLIERSGGPNVDAREIKAMGLHCSIYESAGWISRNSVNRLVVCSLEMPIRSNPERDREIRGMLIDRTVAIIPQLVSIVAEGLAKVIQFGPCGVTRRTRQTIFASKRGNGSHFVQGQG